MPRRLLLSLSALLPSLLLLCVLLSHWPASPCRDACRADALLLCLASLRMCCCAVLLCCCAAAVYLLALLLPWLLLLCCPAMLYMILCKIPKLCACLCLHFLLESFPVPLFLLLFLLVTQVYSIILPWLDDCVFFLQICKCQCTDVLYLVLNFMSMLNWALFVGLIVLSSDDCCVLYLCILIQWFIMPLMCFWI